MALTYNKNIRDLSIKGTITLTTGEQIHLTTDDIISYSFDSQIGSEGLPLGSAEAVNFSLEISNIERRNTPAQFDNAEVHMFVGIHDGSDYVYSDFGVWYVDTSTAPEQSVSISLSGYDALATRFEDYFVDSKGAYPTTIGRIATDVCLASGIRLKTADFPNAGVTISEMPTWDEEVTLRDVLSYCAICAGGYVRIARNGQVEIVGFMDGQTYELDPDSYQTFTLTGGTAFKFNAIEAMLTEDAEEYTRYAINSNIASDATNTIQIEYNPLLTDAILQSITTELSGIEIEAGTITWGGDPSVECTDYYEVTMLDGTVRKIMVTSQNFSFDGGLSVTESCDLPAKNAVGSPTYSTSTNMYDAKGRIKASRIPGLDKQVISATVGHFDQLTADTAEFDELLAAYINAINLLVDKIDANAIKAGTITADKIDANALDAVSLEAITAKIESLTANDIETDRLAAALADFTVVTAGSAVFDRTTVQNLIASALNVKDAVGENVFIENLSIRDAQIVGATVGTLCIKASNGRYYNIDVDPKTGNIISTDVTETIDATDVEAGVTPDGKRVIIETSITADELNAVSLKAVHALINSIDAARIDADEFFAREAVIDLLRTAKIVNDKSITMIAGEVEDLDRLSNIEVIEGTFAQTERREGEGIRIYSEIGPKQDLKWGDPYPGGAGKNLFSATWEQGNIGGDGVESVSYVEVRSGYVAVNASETYAVSRTVRTSYVKVRGYAADKTFVGAGAAVIELVRGEGDATAANPLIKDARTCVIKIKPGVSFLRFVDASNDLSTLYQLELGSVITDYAPYANTPPIEGWTGLNAFAGGKNLLKNDAISQTLNGMTITVNEDGSVTVNGTSTATSTPTLSNNIIPAGRYILSGCPAGGAYSGDGSYRLQADITMPDGTIKYISDIGSGTAFTLDETPVSVAVFIILAKNGIYDELTFNPMLRVAHDADAVFQPYQGSTYSLDFGETVYGGTVDWHAGEMTVEWAMYQPTSDSTWYVEPKDTGVTRATQQKTVDAENPNAGGFFSHGIYLRLWSDNRPHAYIGDGKFSMTMPTSVIGTTSESINAYIDAQRTAGTPMQISYKFAEPYTIQLTPVQIETLQGINTVYTDADGGRVEFGHSLLPDAVKELKGEIGEVRQTANAAVSAEDFKRVVRLDGEGLHVGDNKTSNEVLIDSDSVNVVMSGQKYSRFTADYVQFGDYQLRKSADGGLVFKL